MNPKVKGLVHTGLAVAALVEAFTSESRFRRFLNCVSAGYHMHATMYHLLYEKETPTWKEVVHGFDEEDYEEEYWDT